jgi:MFS family permease
MAPPNQPAGPRILLQALLPFALGYLMSYLLRAVNAVAGPVLAKEFDLGAGELGLLTAAYLGAFSLFQLPLGVLLDRYGPRRVQASLLSVAALGTLAFALAPSFGALFAARAVIGLGFAAGLMASFKAVVLWVEPDRRPLVNSCVVAFGGLGILLATEPTQLLLGIMPWRHVFMLFAGLIAATAILVFAVVPEKTGTADAAPLGVQISQLAAILRSAPFWRAGPLLGLCAGIQIAIITLWSGPWFRDVAGLPKEDVARQLLWMAVAFILGLLSSGIIADRLGRRGIGPMAVMLGYQAIYFASQAVLIVQWLPAAPAAWLLLAATGQTAILGFPWLQRQFPQELAGRSNSTLNFAMFAVAFAAQYAIGLVLDLFPRTGDGYAPQGYAWAFGLCLASQLLALLWYLWPHAKPRPR